MFEQKYYTRHLIKDVLGNKDLYADRRIQIKLSEKH